MKAQILKIAVIIFLATNVVMAQRPTLQNYVPLGQERATMFESPKTDSIEFNGVAVRIGGAFAQQFQALNHSNQYTLDNVTNDSPDPTLYLVDLKNGFNLAAANLNVDVQLADGIRLELVTYLSARHHQEAWVKGGYIQFDKLPINSTFVENFMKNATIRIGHMEVNYGDGHFRRTDNGNAITNPFVGNYIMDAFNTEIGGEIYYRTNGFIGMLGITEGEIKGEVKGTNQNSGASFYGKLGYDNYLNDDLRVRLTGSFYRTEDLVNSNNIYSGDRAGSRYYYVTATQRKFDWRSGGLISTTAANEFTTGRYNPGFSNSVTSVMINPYVKYRGLEFFGMYETSKGWSGDEANERSVNQLSGEVIYRFLPNEQLFIGARYNTVAGELEAQDVDASISRTQISAGWFLTKNVVAKVEYVKQNYNDFTQGGRFENAQFDGLMFEAVIGF